jgi:hypothetical protein
MHQNEFDINKKTGGNVNSTWKPNDMGSPKSCAKKKFLRKLMNYPWIFW